MERQDREEVWRQLVPAFALGSTPDWALDWTRAPRQMCCGVLHTLLTCSAVYMECSVFSTLTLWFTIILFSP